MKSCKRCTIEKPDSDFYPSDRTCKECRKSLVRANRAAKVDQYRAYDKARAMRPDRVQARAEYAKTDAGAERVSRAKKRYIERNPVKRAAHIAVGNAIRSGRLWKSPCCMAPGCFSQEGLHAHHTHYSFKLDVVWLCTGCHSTLHREFGDLQE